MATSTSADQSVHQLSGVTVTAAKTQNNDNDFRTRLSSLPNPKDYVIFDVQPNVQEAREVRYKELQLIQGPGSIMSYEGTSSRSFTIEQIKLVSRNGYEATMNMYTLNMIRSWAQPYFGIGTSNALLQSTYKNNFLGAPPDVLSLSSYSKTNMLGNINQIPVVLRTYSFNYSPDVDFIPTVAGGSINKNGKSRYRFIERIAGGIPFPIIMEVSITLLETHSPTQYSQQFNLMDFKQGQLPGF